jgi:sigma-B regulation protein RsbQ
MAAPYPQAAIALGKLPGARPPRRRADDRGMRVASDALVRNNVTIAGAADGGTLLFVHGLGCDQSAWRHVAPAFAADHRVVLLDNVGAGGSEVAAYDRERHGTLEGYAVDVLEILDELDPPGPVTLVGHCVGAMIGVLAANARPERFDGLVLIGAAPRYADDDGYLGMLSPADLDELLELLDASHLGWSRALAPAIMGREDRPDLEAELTRSFCRTDPGIARHFARVAFLADHRPALALVTTPTLVLQCAEDFIAPEPVGEYVHRQIAGSRLVHMRARGHCPHLSAPEETVAAIRAFL